MTDTRRVGAAASAAPTSFSLTPTLVSRNNPVSNDRLLANARANVAKGHRQVEPATAEIDEPIAVVGGGPSLTPTLPALKAFPWKIVAAGSSHDWLVRQGIVPWAATCLDPLPAMASYYTLPQRKTRYLIASTCDPSVFKALRGAKRFLWHPNVGVDLRFAKPKMLVEGGCTVVLRSLNLLYGMGYRNFHFFGFDGCDDPETGRHHAYDTPPDGEVQTYRLGCREYQVRGSLIIQFHEWDLMLAHHGDKFRATVHGGGLMAALHRERAMLGI